MKLKYLVVFIFTYLALATPSLGQTIVMVEPLLTDEQLALIKSNAIELIRETGKNSLDLTDGNSRIESHFQTAKLLYKYDPNISINFLEKAWRDSFSDDLKNKPYTNSQRNKIIDLASKIAPEYAKKWLGEITQNKIDEESLNVKTANMTDREMANLTLRVALAKLETNPDVAVSLALSSLSQYGKLSKGFGPFVDRLVVLNRLDLEISVLKGISDFIKDRPSLDGEDLLAAMNLLVSKHASVEYRTKLFAYLLDSGRLIIRNQSQGSEGQSNRLSGDQMDLIYSYFNFPLHAFTLNEFTSGLASLDEVMSEMRQFVSPGLLTDPLRNPLPIERQIEDAMKVVGSKERDARLVKIATWLLGRRKGNEKNNLTLAIDVSDNISNLEIRETLRDYVKMAEIETLVEQKDFSGAEKKARSISLPELKTWELIVIGKLQGGNNSIAADLYEAALDSLQKAAATNYKTQLALILASLFRKHDEGKSLEILSQAVKFSNEAKKQEEEKHEIGLMFDTHLGGMDFADYDFDVLATNVEIPKELGKLAINFWFPCVNLSRQMQPLVLRLNLQRMLAESALKYVDAAEQNKKKKENEPHKRA
ncbi:MAG TPA: hypothetical protein PLP07_13375 [Pyrinomonadaceae bacterium]|nr:hypothetical protein [Chloracidobacterium sp.]MBP9935079.1 hypothetical protein [Pyrinomonadaceae bacterium]MBK7803496.1 hypothetical protein [Chloracidobacterium sp.]MBK9438743.1 hypothetical protein [Chloracidobacterium sp.]MBL0241270.1 hypothetical protein [Chloracidobacterium sp.]